MLLRFASAWVFLLLISCFTPARKSQNVSLEEWMRAQEEISWNHLLKNISPKEPKVEGGPPPKAGIVVAALHKKDPDYYFHWVRDSANVMRAVVERTDARKLDPSQLQILMRDFVQISERLQGLGGPYGMGEPRFTVEGQIDPLPWSRPQYDGPALRALALIGYSDLARQYDKDLQAVLIKDLNFLTEVYNAKGFDLWEELKAENYHTRLVQVAALERGAKKLRKKKYLDVAAKLTKQLDQHWSPEKGYLRSQLVIERTDGYTKKNTDLDSAVVVAVVESGRVSGAHSVLDDRVHATVQKLEELFRTTFPINQNTQLGLAYGRYLNDHYFGGNPWFLITAYYAQFYYRLAGALAAGADLQVTENNLNFVRDLLKKNSPHVELEPGTFAKGDPIHELFMASCVKKADRILDRIRFHTPEDGQLYEQFDKLSGKPVSSRGIGWSHSSLISALLERDRMMLKK